MPRLFALFALCLLLPAGLAAQVLLPLLFQGERITGVHHAFEDERDGTVWLATSEGLFSTSQGNSLSERLPEDGIRRELQHVARVGDELWVGGEGGVYEIGDQYTKIPAQLPEPVTVYTIFTEPAGSDEGVWLATSEGVYRRGTGGTFDRLLAGESTFLGYADRGEEDPPGQLWTLWASNDQGFFKLNRRTRRFEEFTQHDIVNVAKVLADQDGQIYLWALDNQGERGKRGASLYEHPSGKIVGPRSGYPLDAKILDGLLWFSVDNKIYSRGPTGAQERDLCKDIRVVKSFAKTSAEKKEYIWIFHRYGVRRYSSGESSGCRALAVGTEGHEWDLTSILPTQNSGLLLWGPGGIYRFREEIKIQLEIAKESYQIVNRYSVGDTDYYDSQDRKWPAPPGITKQFSAIIATSEPVLDDPSISYHPVQSWSRFGYADSYYVSTHDYYGNTQPTTRSKAVLVSSFPWMWLVYYLLSTVLPVLFVWSMVRKIPLFIRILVYTIAASVLAPNPLPRSLLLLSLKSMRRRLRDIHADSWLHDHGGDVDLPANLIPRLIAEGEVFLTEKDGVALEDIATEVSRRSGKDPLRDSIALVYDLRKSEAESSGDIRKEMNALMRESISWYPFFGEWFSAQLLEKGDFVFLFRYQEGDDKIRYAARDFAASYERRRLVLSAVPAGAEPREESSPQVEGGWIAKLLSKREKRAAAGDVQHRAGG